MDIITGVHSICVALKNNQRVSKELTLNEEGKKLLEKELTHSLSNIEDLRLEILSSHEVQERAKEECRELGFQYTRFPSNMFLKASKLEDKELTWLYDHLISGDVKKIIALDQVSDAHNGAAIMRTAAFYGVDALLVASKGNFGVSPSYFRIASGASEFVPLVRASSLAKTIGKLQKMGVHCIGLSEHAENIRQKEAPSNAPLCLVLGAEDLGLGNAVKRQLEDLIALKPLGKIKSLNVSVAAAIAMEKVFSK